MIDHLKTTSAAYTNDFNGSMVKENFVSVVDPNNSGVQIDPNPGRQVSRDLKRFSMDALYAEDYN